MIIHILSLDNTFRFTCISHLLISETKWTFDQFGCLAGWHSLPNRFLENQWSVGPTFELVTQHADPTQLEWCKDQDKYLYAFQGYRVTKYVPHEIITDPEEVLEKWESVPTHDNAKSIIRDIRDRIDVQDLNMRTVKSKLAKQEHCLIRIR